MNQENRREPATSETAVKRELSSSFRLLRKRRECQAVDGKHQQQDEAEQQQIADPEPETGQGGEGDQAQQGMGQMGLQQMEEPVTGEDDHHRQVNGEQEQQGEDHAEGDPRSPPGCSRPYNLSMASSRARSPAEADRAMATRAAATMAGDWFREA